MQLNIKTRTMINKLNTIHIVINCDNLNVHQIRWINQSKQDTKIYTIKKMELISVYIMLFTQFSVRLR